MAEITSDEVKKEKICVIGLGFVGLSTAVYFASRGHEVVGVDRDVEKCKKINRGESPIKEIPLLAHIKASSSPPQDMDIYFICVPTPSNEDGIDLSYLIQACHELRDKAGEGIVVVRSTVTPGTTEKIILPAINSFNIVVNPEFLQEGSALANSFHPSRVVIGAEDPRLGDRIERLYDGPFIRTNWKSAELIKYASNAALAAKISFVNEISNIAKLLGADTKMVLQGVGTDPRFSPRYMEPGIGFGGSCLPKDLYALIKSSERAGYNPKLLRSVYELNEEQPKRAIELLEERMGGLDGKRVALLGLSFKEGVEDVRGSRSFLLVKELQRRGAQVVVYDPCESCMDAFKRRYGNAIEYSKKPLEGTDGCIIATPWNGIEKFLKGNVPTIFGRPYPGFKSGGLNW